VLPDGSRFCASCGEKLPEFPLPPGTRLEGDRYEIVELIKTGGMGAVYRGQDVRLKKAVAIKQLLPAVQHESYLKERFEAEAGWLSQLSHPSLPRVTDTFERENCRFHVMDLIPGRDLDVHVETHGPVSLEQARSIALQLLEVLGFLHTQSPPVVYRDLKPANVLYSDDGKVTLVDFGLARSSSAVTATAIGTEGYCPLEQYQGKAEPRSDLYALGATLYHLVTGRCPQPLSYVSPGPEVPAFLDAILAKAMALQPADRFADVPAMRAAIEAWDRTAPAAKDGALVVEVPAGPALVGVERRKVELAGYWIDRTPVTRGQFRQFLQSTGYRPQGEWERWSRTGADDHPAVGVTWQDALEYCRWARKRLPTADEWEKAARGTDGRLFPWGDQFAADRCCHGDTASPRMLSLTNGRGTMPVGSFPAGASPAGCLDMAGNVWEWTATAGARPETRLLKGGCWANRDPQALQASGALEAAEASSDCRRGFRGIPIEMG